MFNYFKTIELKYKYQLSKSKPIVVRFDGKNITKSKQFDLSKKNEFTSALLSTTEQIVNRFDSCIAYVAIDEVNIIFTDPNDFFNYYTTNSDSLQYCLSMIQQDFLSIFWKHIPDIFFGVSIFNIPKEKVDSYIKYRKTSAYNVAVTYFAKRHFEKTLYQNKKQKEILSLIENSGITKQFYNYNHFTNGTIIDNKLMCQKNKEYDSALFDDFV